MSFSCYDDWAEQSSAEAAAVNAAQRASGLQTYPLARVDLVHLCRGARVPGGRRRFAKLRDRELWELYVKTVPLR